MSSKKVLEIIPQIQKITGIYRCFNIPITTPFKYQSDQQPYNESHFVHDQKLITELKKHPVVTTMGFYIHPSNQ